MGSVPNLGTEHQEPKLGWIGYLAEVILGSEPPPQNTDLTGVRGFGHSPTESSPPSPAARPPEVLQAVQNGVPSVALDRTTMEMLAGMLEDSSESSSERVLAAGDHRMASLTRLIVQLFLRPPVHPDSNLERRVAASVSFDEAVGAATTRIEASTDLAREIGELRARVASEQARDAAASKKSYQDTLRVENAEALCRPTANLEDLGLARLGLDKCSTEAVRAALSNRDTSESSAEQLKTTARIPRSSTGFFAFVAVRSTWRAPGSRHPSALPRPARALSGRLGRRTGPPANRPSAQADASASKRPGKKTSADESSSKAVSRYKPSKSSAQVVDLTGDDSQSGHASTLSQTSPLDALRSPVTRRGTPRRPAATTAILRGMVDAENAAASDEFVFGSSPTGAATQDEASAARDGVTAQDEGEAPAGTEVSSVPKGKEACQVGATETSPVTEAGLTPRDDDLTVSTGNNDSAGGAAIASPYFSTSSDAPGDASCRAQPSPSCDDSASEAPTEEFPVTPPSTPHFEASVPRSSSRLPTPGSRATSLRSRSRSSVQISATLSSLPGFDTSSQAPVLRLPDSVADPQPIVRQSKKLPSSGYDFLEPGFSLIGGQECWNEILNRRLPPPISNNAVTLCEPGGVMGFAGFSASDHPWQQLCDHFPEVPSLFELPAMTPDTKISIRVPVEERWFKIWLKLRGVTVLGDVHQDIGFASWERSHWIPILVVENWFKGCEMQIRLMESRPVPANPRPHEDPVRIRASLERVRQEWTKPRLAVRAFGAHIPSGANCLGPSVNGLVQRSEGSGSARALA
ncbi:unnamed protein product [Phytophthora lilii]|uniref:Unnamed protein product n=1 Tax=Phytophthora lilii TaxID=2077276 RepID=A0A9W6TDG9_9STRA|nr:unnamed protein product [Phytophthora lilii]